jgi:D-glycero-D-manno-heptose 1,7-bisphosphate phosphatase
MPLKQASLSNLALIEGADEAVSRLSREGFLCPVVTVQSRIAMGLFSREEFLSWFKDFSDQLATRGASLCGPYVCPHRYAEPCACKKPNTLLYELAATEHGIDLERSYSIGDTAADVRAAFHFGGQGCLVRTGWAASDSVAEEAAPYAAYVADSLAQVVTWILGHEKAESCLKQRYHMLP